MGSASLSTSLIGGCYRSSMAQIASAMVMAPSTTIGVDGVTKIIPRSMNNVIAHAPAHGLWNSYEQT
ncbi:hypothetical protein PC112_g13758 [Phytophthora cactorum]|nr:hypothetical protein PC112_g13758 [Phytophthora cactorum]KAG2910232.1 hypothetical protein PC115_g12945 [Phytophthora cactorum]KAG3017783.1 hypothetical protein PC120_g10816 [Phytophthora cactorum]KAG3155798.1 hypothetical protein PC128_g22008 [Phytophthora cactorum]